jgi:hypothetical protein
LSEKALRNLHLSISRFGDTDEQYDRIVQDAELDGKSRDVVLGASEELFDAAYAAVVKAMEAEDFLDAGSDHTDSSIRRKAERYACDLPPKSKMIFADSGKLKQFNCTRLLVHCHEVRALTSRFVLCLSYVRFTSSTSKKDLLAFRVSGKLKSVTNWKSLWTVKDDSMLMVGVFRHGLAMAGCWERIEADPDLGFAGKFFLTGGAGDLPGAVHLYRRARSILKVLGAEDDARHQLRKKKKKASKKASEGDKAFGTGGSKGKKRESAGKGKKRERDSSSAAPRDTKSGVFTESDDDFESIPVPKSRESKKVKKSDSASHSRRGSTEDNNGKSMAISPEVDSDQPIDASSSATTPISGLMKDYMAPVLKSLRSIKSSKLPDDMTIFKSSLVVCGDRINKCLKAEPDNDKLKSRLWNWLVANYWPNSNVKGNQV